MDRSFTWKTCQCGRHGHFVLVETGQRASPEFISQTVPIQLWGMMCDEGTISRRHYEGLCQDILRSSLPAHAVCKTPAGLVAMIGLKPANYVFDWVLLSRDEEEPFLDYVHGLFDQGRVSQLVIP